MALAGLSGAMNGGVRVDFRIGHESLFWKQGSADALCALAGGQLALYFFEYSD